MPEPREEPRDDREWAQLIACQFETDAIDAIEEGISRGRALSPPPADSGVVEALNLATALHRRWYSHVPQWKPLDDAAGIISQIDNMTAGLGERLDAAEAALRRIAGPDGYRNNDPHDPMNIAAAALAKVQP